MYMRGFRSGKKLSEAEDYWISIGEGICHNTSFPSFLTIPIVKLPPKLVLARVLLIELPRKLNLTRKTAKGVVQLSSLKPTSTLLPAKSPLDILIMQSR